MLTVIEKVIFLQNVDLFLEVPSEQLAYLASIAEETTFLQDDDICKADEPADAMYLVLEGKIKLHRDGNEITSIGEKEAFGTWALFDEEPRVATATAEVDSKLLRINRGDFYDLLADNIQITQGIFKTLTKRMRKLIGSVKIDPAGKKQA